MGILLLTLLVILLLVCGVTILLLAGFPVRIAPRVIERALAVKLPLKKPLKWASELEVTAVHLDSSERGDRLGLRVSLTLTGLPAVGTLSQKVDVSAAIQWEDSAGELFLRQTKIERLSVEGLPDLVLIPMREAVSAVVKEVLEAYPVYRLEAKTRLLSAVRAVVKDVRVQGGCVELRLGGSAESLVRFGHALTGRPAAK